MLAILFVVTPEFECKKKPQNNGNANELAKRAASAADCPDLWRAELVNVMDILTQQLIAPRNLQRMYSCRGLSKDLCSVQEILVYA